jgi:periplasmic divalent cation tolerance protein
VHAPGEAVQIQVVHSERAALQAIVEDLLERRLIACGQLIGPIASSFRWQGELQHEEEWLALLKTWQAALPAALQRVRELHSYEVPEILVFEIACGEGSYLRWVQEETTPAGEEA